MNYQDALSWVHSLSRFGSNPGLERIEELLAGLGNPHTRLRCIHIAGTNGKGSVAAFLTSMLEAEGWRVGLYTSPYLESFTNRMAINGRDIGEEHLARLVARIRPLVEDIAATELGQPTEFEVVTALAFTYFAEQAPDWVVVEVGLGGRLDATNVILPEACVITNIGLEHTQILGDTVALIAFEKAGIIKAGVPVVTAAEKREALTVIGDVASLHGARLLMVDRDIRYQRTGSSLDGQTFDYHGIGLDFTELEIPLLGAHQVRNAVTALAARELLNRDGFDETAARTGLKAVFWPGRLEIFSREPLVLVDGAHNQDGIVALKKALHEILEGRKLHLVLGILADKAVEEILSLIAPIATAGLVITRPDSPRAADPYAVAGIASRFTEIPVRVVEPVAAAVADGLAAIHPGEVLCISGSLYTVSEARKAIKKLLL